MGQIINPEIVVQKIYWIRGQKVMLDKDLAFLYGVKPIRLREQVKRNPKRFPADFMFPLNNAEIDQMVSQNAIPSRQYLGGHSPLVFTEQGIAMLSTVLNSERAIEVNIAIMRAFVKLRQILAFHKEVADRLAELERRMDKKDREILALFEEIRKLMEPPPEPPPEKPKMGIGFHVRP